VDAIEVDGLEKRYGEVHAVKGVSFAVARGETFGILGPNGAGKTTTLEMIEGLTRPDAGSIEILGQAVWPNPTRVQSHIGVQLQKNALFENLTAAELLDLFGRFYGVPLEGRAPRLLALVGLEEKADSQARQLSGGQQQRLAFARGLVREPKILLLDEPLSNLDAKLREQMRVELKRLQTSLGITTVYVTHDQSEALALSDEIAVFSAGKIIQRGTPHEIYRQPKSQFVADFIGSANFLNGTVREGTNAEGTATVETPYGVFRCGFAQAVVSGQSVLVSARPEDLALSEKSPGDGFNVLAGKIAHRVFLGEVVDYLVDTGGAEIRVRTKPEQDFHVGQPVHVSVAPGKCVGLPS
jgi:iron(III) transport system ATP-binding protein